MRCAVTGASGFIGRRLCARLAASGHEPVPVRRLAEAFAPADLAGAEAVIHLAGEPVAQRWTTAARERIHRSRVEGTRLLAQHLAQAARPPRILLCASAIGFYGDRNDAEVDEEAAAGEGFLAELCQAWEAAADPARKAGIRVVHLRLGLVLGADGGALARMLPAFRCGLGGRLGSGRQWWSWIALDDLLRLVLFCLDQPDLSGPVNAAAPQAVRQSDFARTLGRILHRPALLPVPAWLLRLALGPMARELLLASCRVVPQRALAASFTFADDQLERCLAGLLTTTGPADSSRA